MISALQVRLEVVAWSDRATSSVEEQVIEDAIQTLQIRPPETPHGFRDND